MVITTAKMLSHVIREFRYQGNLSQTDVAKLASTTQARISVFENEPERTKLETLFKILAGLELELIVQPRKKSAVTENLISEPTPAFSDDDEAW
ncbi:helix-turn-helix domain-containing protein [Aggregatibacter actinomycetemcomitans]|uniref:helix-turn-helix domain-containing protein n=1 Tax=Aggregatibacter actinomycetemcomitans TaxID=714 RepID=UPI00024348E5|nr:helix-turn-helix domain-containing protein [Aggregatibacter actinomycetemcomitans]AEW77351.1 HTH-type transcriptional regulator HipB [Aggregatibacter actinomycetemcomitans ANH9381]AMQ91503.1 transcriptional regulator [Aggregatibacter actinomycetemcomitans]KND82783.1 transcriptional regulator [Aggregatibacter actinomycetemcomitans serotype b str. SCC1398]KOE51800.1 transcriptional regulator [Aggregatibacter actinomycetemcomitans serotype b str. I23C]KOE53254.1 transcriptional regulator [Aggr